MREHDDHLESRFPKRLWQKSIHLSLIICAIALLLTRPYVVKAIRGHEYSPIWLLVGPSIFLILFLAYLATEFIFKKKPFESLADYLKVISGILIIALSYPSSFREYQVRKIPDPISMEIFETFIKHRDARIRALTILASARRNFNDPAIGALIHKGLLDKDPLVQQAAKLVIEDNLGISLKNGAEGIHQAQSIILDAGSQALLIKKGSP